MSFWRFLLTDLLKKKIDKASRQLRAFPEVKEEIFEGIREVTESQQQLTMALKNVEANAEIRNTVRLRT